MTDDEHSTTQTLRLRAPFWGWVRSNILTLIPLLSVVIYGWFDLKARLEKVEEGIKRTPEISAKEFTDLRSEVDRQKGRWEQVDSVPELKGHRRK